jgi:hypothetical protein
MLVKFYAKDLVKLLSRNIETVSGEFRHLAIIRKSFWPWQDKTKYYNNRMTIENMKNKLCRLRQYHNALVNSLHSNSDQDYLVELSHYEYADISTCSYD